MTVHVTTFGKIRFESLERAKWGGQLTLTLLVEEMGTRDYVSLFMDSTSLRETFQEAMEALDNLEAKEAEKATG